MVRQRSFEPGWQRGENGFDAKKDSNYEILFEVFSRRVLKSSNERVVCMSKDQIVVAEIRYDASGAMLSKSGSFSLKAGLFDAYQYSVGMDKVKLRKLTLLKLIVIVDYDLMDFLYSGDACG